MEKLLHLSEAIAKIPSGATIMFGGFMANGSALTIIDALAETDVKDLTIICNDGGWIDKGVGKLIRNKQCKKLIASHIGLNKEAGHQMKEGELDVQLVPQGTLAEQIRAGGYGLGGILTRTGIGTLVEEGKQKIEVNGTTYLLETPLRADFAIIFGAVVDTFGNIVYHGSATNFNHVMASAADITMVEARAIVEIGALDPNAVTTPGVFINHIVQSETIGGGADA